MSYYDSIKLIDKILDKQSSSNTEREIVLKMVRNDESLAKYFFKKVRDIVWFDSLQSFGFFESSGNPVPVESQEQNGLYSIPFWPVLHYLENISSSSDLVIQKRLLTIISQVTRPSAPLKKADNYHTWHYFSKMLGNIPMDVINLAHIDLISDWLEGRFDTSLVGSEIGKGLLPKLLKSEKQENWEKASKIVEIITELKWLSPRNVKDSKEVEPHLKIESFWMREFFKKNAELLGKKCGSEVISILKSRLSEILDHQKKDRDYAYIWRPAIEPSEQNVGTDQPAHVLIDALRDVLISYASSQDATSEIDKLLESDSPIQKRIAVHVIDTLYGKYQAVFWKYLNPDWFEKFQRHEVYLLLRKHFEQFTNDQKDKVFELIVHLTRDWKEPKDKDRLDMLARAEWLSAIVGKGHDRADALYGEYTKIIGHKPEHPEYLSFMSTSWGHERTVTVEEIFSKGSVKEIVQFLNGFQGKTKWGEPADEGLGEAFRLAVKAKPEFFEPHLSEFLEAKSIYQHYLLGALEDLWNEKKPINWSNVLNLCEAIVKRPELWQRSEPDKNRHFRISWIPATVAGLIAKGVADDAWAFDPALLPQAGRILKEILKNEPSTADGNHEDALTESINTTKGRALGTFFSYALRCSRVYEKEGKDKKVIWDEALAGVFENELSQAKGGNYEFSAIAGEYLPNLYYLNKEWVEKNLADLFPNNDSARIRNWRYVMDGYSYVGTVYTVIYDLLKRNGDLRKVIREVTNVRRVRERVIDNVCVTYLRGQESIDKADSLFKEIIDGWREDDILDVIGLFWQHRDADLQAEHKAKIFDFWRYCHARILKDGEEKNASILSDLNLLAVFLDCIDDEVKAWLLQSAPYVEKRWHSTFLLEYLNRLAETDPKAVGEVMIAMLAKSTPNYQEEHVISIVETLFKKGCRDSANAICDRYGRAGFEFLRPVYEKWNQ